MMKPKPIKVLQYKENAVSRLLRDQAMRTWDNLADATKHNLRWGEETLSDLIGLEIRRAALPNVKWVTFTKAKEAETGADYDLWIERESGSWEHYCLQAKKLNIHESPALYKSLRHKIPKTNDFQIERLEQYGNATRAIPGYIFYNSNIKPPEIVHLCSVIVVAKQVSVWGCTFAPLATVKDLHTIGTQKSFAKLVECGKKHGSPFPWHFLPARSECVTKGSVFQSLPSHVSSLFADLLDGNSDFSAYQKFHEELDQPLPRNVILIEKGRAVEGSSEAG